MEKIIVELEAKTGNATKGIDDIGKSIKELNDKTVKSNRATEKSVDDVGKSAKRSNKMVGLLSKGFKGVGVALKAAGIGLALSALAILYEIISKNQKVLDLLETTTNFIALGFKAVTDALTTAFTAVNNATGGFDALKKTVSGLMTIALTPLKLLFFNLKLAIDSLRVGYETLFGDDEGVKQAKKDLAQTRLEIIEVGAAAVQAAKDVKNNIGEAVSELGEGITAVVTEVGKIDPKKLIETADAMTVLKNNAQIAAAVQAGLVEENDRLAEIQRQIRDEERNSIADRKIANDELLIILQKQELAMLKQADAQIADAQAQFEALGNQENRIALIEAENNRLAVQAQITGLLSEQKINDLGLDREQIEITNTKAESESNLNIAKQKFAAEQLLIESTRLEKLIELNELEKIIESERLEAIIDNANAGTQAKVDAQIALDEFINTNEEKNITLKKDLGLQEVADATAVAEAKLAIQNANLANIEGGIGLLKQIAGKSRALQAAVLIGEAAASVAKTVVATQAANAATFAQGAALAIPSFGASTAVAASLITANSISSALSIGSQIAATATGLSALGKGGAPSRSNTTSKSSSPAVASAPPAFNIVGQSDTNQLANAIGGQANKPQRSYVVSQDITTAQQLDRNIIEGASL
jgi:hypothetical protein